MTGESSLEFDPGPAAIYEGRLRHRRFAPRQHRIEHRLFMLWLDLDRAGELLEPLRLASARRAAPVRLRRQDYFGDPSRPLAESVRDLVAERLGHRPSGPVRLLTHLRTWGVSFNPVSFYYCYDAAEPRRLEAIVAEVHNTPWGERHCYVLGKPESRRGDVAVYGLGKRFHVSPFMPMDVDYTWKLNHPGVGGDDGASLFVHMENWRSGQRLFDASLSLERTGPLTDRGLLRALVRHPLMPVRVLLWIYSHALVLWLKKTPFYGHPSRAGRPAGERRAEDEAS